MAPSYFASNEFLEVSDTDVREILVNIDIYHFLARLSQIRMM